MKTPAKIFSTLILLFLCAFEIQHDVILNQPWEGFILAANKVVYLLVPFWIFGAVSLWSDKLWSEVGVILATVATLGHGVVTLVGASATGGSTLPWIFLISAPILAYLGLYSKRKKSVDRTQDSRDLKSAA
jgi:hypothetical protein